jgi:hypothetical protein
VFPVIGCGPFSEAARDTPGLSHFIADNVFHDVPRSIYSRFSTGNVEPLDLRTFLVGVGFD